MKHTWIRNNNNKLLVFFNGWSCDEHQFAHLKAKRYDVLLLNDYRDLSLSKAMLEAMDEYVEVDVLAWSYGVWVAQYVFEKYQLAKNKAVAINGTTVPVSNQYGIPSAVVKGTLDNLSERNLMKFQRRMLGGSDAWRRFERIKPQRTYEEQSEELAALIEHFKKTVSTETFYQKAIIGLADLIFIADNQRRFWQGKVNIIEVDAPHYCFLGLDNWDDLLV